MKAIRIQSPAGLDNLELVDTDTPSPGPNDILVRAAASSLNFHDYLVVSGATPVPDGRIPMSDVSGEVTAVGDAVTAFAVGDRVMGTFFPRWLGGEPSLAKCWSHIPGDTAEGYASEYVCGPETAFTAIPERYSFEEAATLPCAGLTAWRALFVEGQLQPGETVLVQGSGGVSVFALQMAKAAGATVIATSSSDEKLERLRALGADHCINYRATPEWGKAAAALCPRGGVDHVVEVGGGATLGQSIEACRTGGHVAFIGVLTGMSAEVPTGGLVIKQIRLHGITVGSREQQEAMVRGLDTMDIRPVIDSRFPLADIADAFRHQESQKHFGKICLSYGD
ncbi:NAD(P)-dependent alcohol dehydrogenase [Algiphilus sp.]|uniref:zinc-dependent alcohol dehydrogenase family protein n=1 Tax=Algiphilus sp. TaxID=1872431 RepID=UPI0025C5F97D|nr:NAD(P)-dependent alcohol dehydrogenase [Algiphilus sp.]MCK5771187.1 NAD(P)-dependent alcohol dehydrogenase [Algiphilus sp.]